MEEKTKIVDLLLAKFVSEEIMTKSEFQLSIDRIMDKHEASIDNKFQTMRSEISAIESRMDRQFLKIDSRYNWIIGVTLTSTLSIVGILIKMFSVLPH